jgi:uncharacterized membrane protein (DUF106 family)
MRKMNETAQMGQMLLMLLVIMVIGFIFMDASIRTGVALALNTVFYPLIGFGGANPLLTIVLAGVIVVFLSSFLTHLFTNWKAMGQAQETQKAFQRELSKARKENNQNRLQKLMKMQPQIMKMSMQSQGGMTKSMVFLVIFIAPIFVWLTYFLGNVSYFFFTVPWGSGVSLFDKASMIMSNWFLLYLIFSFLAGQLIRQGLKWISWSDRWQNLKKTIKPSS